MNSQNICGGKVALVTGGTSGIGKSYRGSHSLGRGERRVVIDRAAAKKKEGAQRSVCRNQESSAVVTPRFVRGVDIAKRCRREGDGRFLRSERFGRRRYRV